MANHQTLPQLAKKSFERLEFKESLIKLPLRSLFQQLNEAWIRVDLDEVQHGCELIHELIQEQQPPANADFDSPYVEGLLNFFKGILHLTRGDAERAKESLFESAAFFGKIEDGRYNACVARVALAEALAIQGRRKDALRALGCGFHDFDASLSSPKLESLRNLAQTRFQELSRSVVRQKIRRERVKFPQGQRSRGIEAMPIKGLAGAGRRRLASDETQGYVSVDAVLIEGVHYNIYPIGKDEDIRIFSNHDYVVSPIEGDSMDNAGIQGGDYVLLRRPAQDQPIPRTGDIVLAVSAQGATIKRYRKEKTGEVWLDPESTNQSYEPQKISVGENFSKGQTSIRAIAVAVLKEI